MRHGVGQIIVGNPLRMQVQQLELNCVGNQRIESPRERTRVTGERHQHTECQRIVHHLSCPEGKHEQRANSGDKRRRGRKQDAQLLGLDIAIEDVRLEVLPACFAFHFEASQLDGNDRPQSFQEIRVFAGCEYQSLLTRIAKRTEEDPAQ